MRSASIRKQNHLAALKLSSPKSQTRPVYPVRVLTIVIPTHPDKGFPPLLIDTLNTANDPLPLGQLCQKLRIFPIIKIEMVPSITFGKPKDFGALLEVTTKALVEDIDEGLALLLDEVALAAFLAIDFDHAVTPKPTLDELTSQSMPVLTPFYIANTVGIAHQFFVERKGHTRIDKAHDRTCHIEFVSWFGIAIGKVLRLQPIFR